MTGRFKGTFKKIQILQESNFILRSENDLHGNNSKLHCHDFYIIVFRVIRNDCRGFTTSFSTCNPM
jgi:hypothetical protein